MKLAALFSGGKDSTYAAYIMEQMGHRVDHLVSVLPANEDSWVFHTPNLHLLPSISSAMGKELITRESPGTEEGDLEALHDALVDLQVDGVVTGALASDYQWDRINGICHRLDLPVHSPLWRKDQGMLMHDMVKAGMRTILVTVAAEGLGPGWLGREIDPAALEELERIESRYGINISGEGGEYATLVIDSPLHRHPLLITESEMETSRDGGRLRVVRADTGERDGT
ncbi:MAG: diphthine--ammonia ligase [Methanomassiliicoccales archaeon]